MKRPTKGLNGCTKEFMFLSFDKLNNNLKIFFVIINNGNHHIVTCFSRLALLLCWNVVVSFYYLNWFIITINWISIFYSFDISSHEFLCLWICRIIVIEVNDSLRVHVSNMKLRKRCYNSSCIYNAVDWTKRNGFLISKLIIIVKHQWFQMVSHGKYT